MNRLLRKAVPSALTAEQVAAGPILVIINHRFGGFFAQLNWCLYLLEFARRHGGSIKPMLVSRNYRSSWARINWLDNYFEWLKPPDGRRPRLRYITDFQDMGFSITPDLSLQEAHDVFFSSFAVRRHLLDEVNRFVETSFGPSAVLGLHYRGTDKSDEAARVSYDIAIERARAAARSAGAETIFVSTDEQPFLDQITTSLRDHRVISRQDFSRSTTGRPVHLNHVRGRNGGLGDDAVINSLILSRCSHLVRTSSFLSAWSAIFNPGLSVELLNVPHAGKLYYPEREIMRVLGNSPLNNRLGHHN